MEFKKLNNGEKIPYISYEFMKSNPKKRKRQFAML